ncbi:unnamed protein product [[Candida] boidinii]|nr:hypothetical protein BVG19_g3080 [[Candida] boidinii]OWB53143.1 hypothetical protein B5S27_g4735 [[Candida] boidinii]OWB84135.1 hypothetical protein B5S33_g2775 [[Candida] boidinii]GME88060.1 unnamed protein product [[Candida] boidinii]
MFIKNTIRKQNYKSTVSCMSKQFNAGSNITYTSITKRLFQTSVIRESKGLPSNFKAANLGQNLSQVDILSLSETPRNNIEMISSDSIVFSNLKVIRSPQTIDDKKCIISGLLLDNQIFEMNLGSIEDNLVKINGIQISIDESVLKIFELIYPKPELLVIGLGAKPRLLSPETRKFFSNLGIKLEISDTKHSALNYDLLATERSPGLVGALILPPNF